MRNRTEPQKMWGRTWRQRFSLQKKTHIRCERTEDDAETELAGIRIVRRRLGAVVVWTESNPGRSGDEVRQGWRVNQWIQSTEREARGRRIFVQRSVRSDFIAERTLPGQTES